MHQPPVIFAYSGSGVSPSRRRKPAELVPIAGAASHHPRFRTNVDNSAGQQPLVILASKRSAVGRCALLTCDLCSQQDRGLHPRGVASRTNHCQQAGTPSARHRRSRMNADSRWGRGAIPAVDLLLTESSQKVLSRWEIRNFRT